MYQNSVCNQSLNTAQQSVRRMKKVRYGSRSTSKSKPQQSNLQFLKDGDQDIYSDVLESLSEDYLKYISDMVKVSKTPPKKKKEVDAQQRRINQLFNAKETTCKHQQQLIVLGQQNPRIQLNKDSRIKQQQRQMVYKQEQSFAEADVKNQTKRFKNRQLLETNKIPDTLMKLSRKDKQRYKIREDLLQKYDRKVTEPCAKQRTSETSIIIKNSLDQRNLYQTSECTPRFIINIDEYLNKLQMDTNIHIRKQVSQQKKHKKVRIENQKYQQSDLDNQQLLIQNIRLKKKVRQYEDKVRDLQDSVTDHLDYCKSREKTNKQKIKELVKALAQALTKINYQKSELDTMKDLFKKFGRKVQQYSRYQEHSSVELQQQINHSLKKVLKPTRAKSENRVKKHKRNLDSTLRRLQQDRFIDR